MDDLLYIDAFKIIEPDDSISQALSETLEQLAAIFPTQAIRLHQWNEHYVAVPIKVHVNLPTRGAVNGVDIREEEPVILLFHRELYPYQSPIVYSNRLDFPRDQLPHLNPGNRAYPISFCLYRGKFSDWMAERTIFDLVERIRQWFFDAARNRLIPPGDGWEAIRIDEGVGLTIYPPAVVQDYIKQQWNFTAGESGFSILRYKLSPLQALRSDMDNQPYELLDIVEAKKARQNVKQIRNTYQQTDSSQEESERFLLGLLLWPPRDRICNKYFADIPSNLEELLTWETLLELPVSKALQVYEKNNYQFLNGIPLVLAIRRPTNLIGKTSDIELLNLVITSKQALIKGDSWNENAHIFQLLHRTPLTVRAAREISQSHGVEDNKLLIFGCGALGSKLVMHFARNGCTDMTLVDYDELSPHNLVRHALLSNSIGKNKAVALTDEITAMFHEPLRIEAIEYNGINILLEKGKKRLRQHEWLVDATASSAFFRALIENNLPGNIRVVRAELGYEGKLGILSIEGSERNPRLDDIQAHLYDLACENTYLSNWLRSERTALHNELQFEEVSIGMGCHTDTMRLSDDVISFHAACFSIGLSKQFRQPLSDIAYLQLSFLDQENDISRLRLKIPKLTVLQARNDPTWQVRIAAGVRQEILGLVQRAGRNETGGVLIGRISLPRKTIHVTKALPPPPDSKSTPYMFVRGISDVWDSVKEINSATGDFIHYVGEWHSHPMGGGQMSETDKRTARDLQSVLRSAGLPTHILIVTPSELVSHVYPGNTTI